MRNDECGMQNVESKPFIIHNSAFSIKKIVVSLPLQKHAGVAELVDALDLGSSFSRSKGSSPFIRTKQR